MIGVIFGYTLGVKKFRSLVPLGIAVALAAMLSRGPEELTRISFRQPPGFSDVYQSSGFFFFRWRGSTKWSEARHRAKMVSLGLRPSRWLVRNQESGWVFVPNCNGKVEHPGNLPQWEYCEGSDIHYRLTIAVEQLLNEQFRFPDYFKYVLRVDTELGRYDENATLKDITLEVAVCEPKEPASVLRSRLMMACGLSREQVIISYPPDGHPF